MAVFLLYHYRHVNFIANIKKHSHSLLRYLCTLGFPLMAAILTGLLPGLITSLELRPWLRPFRLEAGTVLDCCWPLRPWCPLSNENETSESVPVCCEKTKRKTKIHMQNQTCVHSKINGKMAKKYVCKNKMC